MIFSLSLLSISPSYFISKPFSFNIFSASDNVLYVISGTVTVFTSSLVSSLSCFNSKYGNTSPSTLPATGAATAPPWVILTTQIF